MPFTAPPADAPVALLARRIADYAVLNSDPDVPAAAADYFEVSRPHYLSVRDRIEALTEQRPALAPLHRAVTDRPGSPGPWRAFRDAVAELLAERPDLRRTVREALAAADPEIWTDHLLGEEYDPDPDTESSARLDRLAAQAVPAAAAPGGAPGPRVRVVIPFRDREHGARTRNLLACLLALRDQEDPGELRITVVEADQTPRSRELLAGRVDDYLHAPAAGLFNKAWAVNVGVRAAGAPGTSGAPELICVLDADILVERTFAAVNKARFAAGHDAHLPYRHMFSLDGPATARAVHDRLTERRPAADPEALRGLLLRETPGACLWVRTEAFHRIGGFDERFEGWGGEDDDMVGRLRRFCRLTRFDDPLLHLDHPRPAMVREDGTAFNAHLAEAYGGDEAWTARDGFGDICRYSAAASGTAAAASGTAAAASGTAAAASAVIASGTRAGR